MEGSLYLEGSLRLSFREWEGSKNVSEGITLGAGEMLVVWGQTGRM